MPLPLTDFQMDLLRKISTIPFIAHEDDRNPDLVAAMQVLVRLGLARIVIPEPTVPAYAPDCDCQIWFALMPGIAAAQLDSAPFVTDGTLSLDGPEDQPYAVRTGMLLCMLAQLALLGRSVPPMGYPIRLRIDFNGQVVSGSVNHPVEDPS